MGGTWTTQNKVMPGVYVNFLSNKPLAINQEERGIVAIPMIMKWGEKGKVYEISTGDDTFGSLGFSKSELIPIREALKSASKVLAYKVNGGIKAQEVITDGVNGVAICEGSRGNDISIIIKDKSGKYEISTYVKSVKVDSQEVTVFEEFKTNEWIEITGTGVISEKTVVLSGGSDTTPTTSDYETCLNGLRTEFFNTLAYTGTDVNVKQAIDTFIRSMREEEGVKIQGVLAEYEGDYEGIISVGNGVKLEDGTILNSAECCSWVAGVTAGAKVNQSNTNKRYVGAIDVSPRMNKDEKEEAIKKGEIIFNVNSNQDVTLEYDINSLVTFGEEKSKDFRKNRVVRTLDSINNDIVTIFESNYMGKVNNGPDGRSLLRASIIEYLKELQRLNAIQDFKADDILVKAGTDIDEVTIECYVKPVDSAEKFYINVNVK